MYLTAIAWIYVVLMMSVVEAASPNGSVLGAITTFLLYGVMPLAIVLYIVGTPARRRVRRVREAAQENSVAQPDAGGHPSPGVAGTGAGTGGDTPVRKEP